jgi:dipeptidyl aminopeptidase/acylaminoacyl peptidase
MLRPRQCFFFWICIFSFVRAAEPPGPPFFPLESFFADQVADDLTLSPDGTKAAFRCPVHGVFALGLLDLKTMETGIIFHSRGENISSFFWKGNDRLVFHGYIESSESIVMCSCDPEGKHYRLLYESKADKYSQTPDYARIINELPFDPEHILIFGTDVGAPDFVTFDFSTKVTWGVYRVNVRTGSRDLILMHESGASKWIPDDSGDIRLKKIVRLGKTDWQVRPPGGTSPFKLLTEFPVAEAEFPLNNLHLNPFAFASDNRTLYLVSDRDCDTGALYAYDTVKAEYGPPLFSTPEGEITGIVLSPSHDKLLGVCYETDRARVKWIDPSWQRLQATLDRALPDAVNSIVNWSEDEKSFIVWSHSDRDPGAYYLFKTESGAPVLLRRKMPGIDPALMRPMRPIEYTARDGWKIHGYLTLPAAWVPGRPVPLILRPHGGPYGLRDGWGFDPEVQFLASRGYAVLQVNYRGSGGYGKKFLEAGRHEWGAKMQDDLTDAVGWAVTQGIADPQRVCIFGASYGGYAALAGLTFTPGLYKCAVNFAGVSDLRLITGASMDQSPNGKNFEEVWIGADPSQLDARSPVNYVQNIRSPIFNAYGEDDPRIDIDNWNELRRGLDRYHKPYTFFKARSEGHGFLNEVNRFKFYHALENFLRANL